MELVSEGEFWTWAAGHEIGLDPQFGRSGSLAFLKAPNLWKPWQPAGRISDAPALIAAAVDAAMPEGSYLLWRRGGGPWFDGPESTTRNLAIDIALRGVPVPAEHQGALRLAYSELAMLWVIVFAFFVFGWSVGEDLYLLPTDGSCLLMISHHGELVVTSPSLEHQQRFTAALVSARQIDPDAEGVGVPDRTT